MARGSWHRDGVARGLEESGYEVGELSQVVKSDIMLPELGPRLWDGYYRILNTNSYIGQYLCREMTDPERRASRRKIDVIR